MKLNICDGDGRKRYPSISRRVHAVYERAAQMMARWIMDQGDDHDTLTFWRCKSATGETIVVLARDMRCAREIFSIVLAGEPDSVTRTPSERAYIL